MAASNERCSEHRISLGPRGHGDPAVLLQFINTAAHAAHTDGEEKLSPQLDLPFMSSSLD